MSRTSKPRAGASYERQRITSGRRARPYICYNLKMDSVTKVPNTQSKFLRAFQIFLFILIIVGIGLLIFREMWVPKVVDYILRNNETNIDSSSMKIDGVINKQMTTYTEEQVLTGSPEPHLDVSSSSTQTIAQDTKDAWVEYSDIESGITFQYPTYGLNTKIEKSRSGNHFQFDILAYELNNRYSDTSWYGVYVLIVDLNPEKLSLIDWVQRYICPNFTNNTYSIVKLRSGAEQLRMDTITDDCGPVWHSDGGYTILPLGKYVVFHTIGNEARPGRIKATDIDKFYDSIKEI